VLVLGSKASVVHLAVASNLSLQQEVRLKPVTENDGRTIRMCCTGVGKNSSVGEAWVTNSLLEQPF